MSYGNNHAYRDDTKSANAGEVIVSGKFHFKGASSPTVFASANGESSTTAPNVIESVTYNSAGNYTIKFTDNFYACTGVSLVPESATDADLTCGFGGFTGLGSATAQLSCVIYTKLAGTLNSPSAASVNGVWFTFRFKRTMSV
jgi:hypothetical protein